MKIKEEKQKVEEGEDPIEIQDSIIKAVKNNNTDAPSSAAHSKHLVRNQNLVNIMCHRPPNSTQLYHIFQSGFQEIVLSNNRQSDGFLIHHVKEALIGNREIKNEIGTDEVDPYLQGSFSYVNYWSTRPNSFWCEQCCCPSFIIPMAGSWIMVSVVDPLTPYIHLMLSMDTNNMKLIARLLWALERGFDNLRKYYDEVASLDLQLDNSIPFQWYINGDILQEKPDDNVFNNIQTAIQLLHDKDIVLVI
nr:10394_t:CDS:2 [Entrophospora candida]